VHPVAVDRWVHHEDHSMKKIVLTFGLIAGAVLSAMLLITIPFQDQMGMNTGAIIGYTTMVLAFLLIYFGIRSYRNTVGGGTLSFGRAMAVGSLIALVASSCYVVTWEAIFLKYGDAYTAKYTAHEMAKVQQSGASPDVIAEKKAELEKFAVMYKNPLFNAGITFLEPLPVALLIALVSAGVLSRRRRDQT
jgi:hypothetical protein